MQSQQTAEQRSGTGVGGLVGAVRWLAVLAGLLLLPLHVGAQSPGDLDTSFGDGGKVTASDHDGFHADVALQPDGKIVTAGSIFNPLTSVSDFALVRYHPNGTLDTSFGTDGRVTTDLGESDQFLAVVLQSDGKIIAAGTSLHGNWVAAVARYHPNGTLDTSFGTDGLVTTEVFGSEDMARDVVLQRDGKIVVAGSAHDHTNFSLFVARYHPNGTLDTSFDGDGLVTSNFGDGAWAEAVALQSDGKIVVAGASSGYFALARYHADGRLDTTFSDDGLVTTDFFGNITMTKAITLQQDGKIIAAGDIRSTPHSHDNDFALARYHADGRLDTTFSDDGLVTTDFGSGGESADAALDVVLQSDGKIVAIGQAASTSRGIYALARYESNGTLDADFGSDGLVTTDISHAAASVAIQPHDGRLVVGGDGLARYHAIMCDDVVVTRVGTAGKDTIAGTSGPDVIHGFGGNDLISGLGGNDILCGGKGKDTLRGGGGDDLLHGGPDKDTCNGGPGKGDQAEDCEQVTNVEED